MSSLPLSVSIFPLSYAILAYSNRSTYAANTSKGPLPPSNRLHALGLLNFESRFLIAPAEPQHRPHNKLGAHDSHPGLASELDQHAHTRAAMDSRLGFRMPLLLVANGRY